ncbi:tannase/feruloyl esterase family alpha/beta hydrolase [Streptomyces sp. NBC_01515]
MAVVVAALVTGLALLPDTFSADADASASVTKVSTRPTASGDVGKNLPVTKPKISCTGLLRKDFAALDDAATSVASASVVAKGDANAYEYEYCDVKGTVGPQIQFDLRLPMKTYRQRYLQEGCGGYCGMVGVSAQRAAATGCAPVTDGSFALGQDDQGAQRDAGGVPLDNRLPRGRLDDPARLEARHAAQGRHREVRRPQAEQRPHPGPGDLRLRPGEPQVRRQQGQFELSHLRAGRRRTEGVRGCPTVPRRPGKGCSSRRRGRGRVRCRCTGSGSGSGSCAG